MKLCSIDSMRDSKHKITLLISVALLFASTFVVPAARALAQSSQPQLTTLYSPNKHRNTQRKFCILFHAPERNFEQPCDLFYGLLYAGDDWDWFQSSTALHNRSVIKDLGARNWTDVVRFDPVEPLPKLQPGEQRRITIDVSGKDGKDGAPGAPGAPGSSGTSGLQGLNANGIWDPGPTVLQHRSTQPRQVQPAVQPRPKQDGIPKIDPLFVKAVTGHLYVIHVVDDFRDFYALFRVEALERGNNCTISWRFIPAPEAAGNPQE